MVIQAINALLDQISDATGLTRQQLIAPKEQTFECYAIRQKSTGYFMSMSRDKNHRYSDDEPVASAFPRLFTSRRAASSALSRWLEGKWKIDIIEHFTPYEERIEYGLEVEPVNGRNKDDMEIVPMYLSTIPEGEGNGH